MRRPEGHWHTLHRSHGGLAGALARPNPISAGLTLFGEIDALGDGGLVAELRTLERRLSDELAQAWGGRQAWPVGAVWQQKERRVAWPCLVVGDISGTAFVDERGRRLLEEVLPDGGWDTVEADVVGADGQPRPDYRLIRTPRILPRRVVIDPVLGHDLQTIPDDTDPHPGIGRLATSNGGPGVNLCVSPLVSAALDRARRRRGTRLGGLVMEPMPWTSEIGG
jgi:hypothetical protein